jgi:ribonuclease R
MAKSSRKNTQKVTGLVKRHPDGFGFLVPDNPEIEDVYIPRHEMTGVMANDQVVALLEKEPGGRRWRGKVESVLKRGVKRATGHCEDFGGGRLGLKDASFGWGTNLILQDVGGLHPKPGDWVSVDILTYPESAQGLTGKVVAIIQNMEDPLNDSLRVLHSHSIPFEFSPSTKKEASQLPLGVRESDIRGRKDLRDKPFVTIDGRTAKDFDDAVCVETTPKGFHLWVAIADVSHYVKPQTGIDADAYERGTSTYFPNFVSPMLPEALSNELCSLKPKVPRLALVAEMTLDFQGERQTSQFYEAVIESKARVTYGEAQEIIDGQNPSELSHVRAMILKASDLAKVLMAKRFRDGSLDLEIGETEIEVDETGQPVDILQSERLFAHRLIEELMLAANVSVALELGRRGVGALYRIHEPPNPEAIENLEKYMKTLGSQRTLKGSGLQKKITRALEDFAGHPQQHVLHILTLRSMAQARYSAENLGHFGLGFTDYAHFTSPIRRYPDLIVHRQLKAALRLQGYAQQSQSELESEGTFLSACEQRSVKAERQIKSIKKARFMQRHLGEEFEGMVSSVTRFGLFVILRQFDVDGLIRLESLPGDRFEFDEKNVRLVGKRSGRIIRVGDLIEVQVAAADVSEGRIDFLPAGVSPEDVPQRGERVHQKAQSKPAQKRRPSSHNSRRVRSTRVSSGRRKG